MSFREEIEKIERKQANWFEHKFERQHCSRSVHPGFRSNTK